VVVDLSPSAFGNAGPYLGDPATQEAFGRTVGAQGPAVENLKRLLAQADVLAPA
jgi:hypothetical protein